MIDRDQYCGEDELNAYVDGELPAERRGAVEAWLATPSGGRGESRGLAQAGRAHPARYGAVADEKSAAAAQCRPG